MLVAMAGLPGTGKTALAQRLAVRLEGVVLSKDAVRPHLFPPPVLDYSAAQDDVVMDAIYRALIHILRAHPEQVVILDGRTFSRTVQVQAFVAAAVSAAQPVHLIECTCTDELARARLERTQSKHPAANRSFDLYMQMKANREPIELPHLVLDTGLLNVELAL